jgi:hypothetical protein
LGQMAYHLGATAGAAASDLACDGTLN